MSLIKFIISHTNLLEKGIRNTVELLNEDCTIPFISRYRKERTGNLDEVQIANIVKYKNLFEEIEKRKITIIKALEEQEVITEELRQKINAASDLITLEDLYLPFKKKRKTKAETARKNGLKPLAKIIMSQNANDIYSIASKYCNKEVKNEEEALEGARHIIAEWINERTDIRNQIRAQLEKYATINSSVIKTKENDESAQKYRDYFNWSESLSRCPSHRILAILRAEKEGFIRVKIEIDDDKALGNIENRIIRSNIECADQIKIAVHDSYKSLLFPALSNEIMNIAKEKADDSAINVFTKNLKQLLLGAPLGEKNILAIDPGFRSGCKIVCLNRRGELVYNETVYPHAPQNDALGAIKKISSLVDAYKIEAIAIGNGTASRETEQLIRKMRFTKDIQVFVVSEAGASIYSASKIAREEFPNYDVTVRGAVSIGRRLADPLAELVKIDAKSIGIGQYQHDVDQSKLKKALDTVVESCVNTVGVNINTASKPLLSYVSGIGPKLAENIIDYRNKHGGFKSRNDIKKVPRLGDKAFEQGAGFLRIKNANNPLDDSAVHPESYKIVQKMATDLNKSISDLIGNKTVLEKLNVEKYVTNSVGLPTLTDIVKEIEKPGLDPREQVKVFTFNKDIRTINDLKVGQLLPGIVNNITNFGCFVDIGLKESGLVHVSNLADKYVSNINEIVSLHQQVIVKVLEVDIPRKRIQLSMNYK
ncbi:MAG: RNA-binding transcriptional accessory protein [Flavobacteriaceae bacterium]|nr:RNA-binding transcriptional accessory protein [Flavobacteriaceae bacterium]